MDKFTINSLNLFYQDFWALKNINLKIANKKITAFIGPSGCGKSTLLRSLNRMNDLNPTCKINGEILLDSKNIYRIEVTKLRKLVGMVFQKANPFPMSIYDNLTYGPKAHGIKDKIKLQEIVETSLKKAALFDEVKDHLNKNALELSGGQQQRLCIARALSIDPEILLLDEPTSALDPISTGKIEELLINLKANLTIVIVTHHMHQAKRISDDLAFFLHGELIEFNQTEEIFKNSKDPRTQDYIFGKFG